MTPIVKTAVTLTVTADQTSERFPLAWTARVTARLQPGTTITSYAFDWGDGTTTTTADPVAPHDDRKPNTYLVTVVASDSRAMTAKGQRDGGSQRPAGRSDANLAVAVGGPSAAERITPACWSGVIYLLLPPI